MGNVQVRSAVPHSLHVCPLCGTAQPFIPPPAPHLKLRGGAGLDGVVARVVGAGRHLVQQHRAVGQQEGLHAKHARACGHHTTAGRRGIEIEREGLHIKQAQAWMAWGRGGARAGVR